MAFCFAGNLGCRDELTGSLAGLCTAALDVNANPAVAAGFSLLRLGSYDFNLAPFVQYLQAHQIGLPLQKEVYTRVAHSQIPDPKFGNSFGEIGTVKANLFLCGVQGEAETGLQRQQNGAGSPSLRRARDWI